MCIRHDFGRSSSFETPTQENPNLTKLMVQTLHRRHLAVKVHLDPAVAAREAGLLTTMWSSWKWSTLWASPSEPRASRSISPIIDTVPMGRSISAAMVLSPGVPARVSAGSAPNCCSYIRLLPTKSVKVCTSRTVPPVSMCSRSRSRRCARSSVALAATSATQRLRLKLRV